MTQKAIGNHFILSRGAMSRQRTESSRDGGEDPRALLSPVKAVAEEIYSCGGR